MLPNGSLNGTKTASKTIQKTIAKIEAILGAELQAQGACKPRGVFALPLKLPLILR